ncbi:hypothetical protein VPH35_129318 [Triticum aestivum]
MEAAGDPLQGQACPGQACWPPSRVTTSAVTTTALSSPETMMPLKADLRHVSDPSISSLQQCSGCMHEFDLDNPLVLQVVADFFSGHRIEDFTFSRSEWRCRPKLAVRGTPEKPLIGLYQEWTHTVQDIPDCRGRTGGTSTSNGMKPGHGNPPQPSRPRRRSVLWYESLLHFKTSTYSGRQHARALHSSSCFVLGLMLAAVQGILINMQFSGLQIDAVTNDNIVINVFNNLI